MKLCCAVAVAVLVLALCSQGDSQSANGLGKCCFDYYSKDIPAGRIKAYKVTHPSCPKPGVILITVRNKMLCADPNAKQVQDIKDKISINNLFGLQTTTGSP